MKTVSLRLINNRKGNGDAKTASAVELRVTYGSRVKYFATGVKVTTPQWRDERIVNHPDALTLNAKVSELYMRVARAARDMEEQDGYVDLSRLPDALRRTSGVTFWEFVERRMGQKQVREGTRRRYPVFLNRIREWKMFRYFEDITEGNIRKFDERLHAEGYAQPTVHDYHKHLKQFVNDAVVDGYMRDNPYNVKRIRISKGETGIEKYLTMEELKRVREARLSPTLSKARECFVFCCLTGLSYSDLACFGKDDVCAENGVRYVRGRRVKTGEEFFFMLLPDAVEILDRWGWQLPVPVLSKYNIYLKAVAQFSGIEKPVSSHWARHTAAMYLLNSGIPIEVVSRVLGHSSISTTQRAYARIEERTVIREMSKLR